MKNRERALIAMMLGDEKPNADLQRWLRSPQGRREQGFYADTLEALTQAYGAPPSLEEPIYYTRMRAPIGPLLLAATEGVVVRVSFRHNETEFTTDLRRKLHRIVVPTSSRLRPITDQLADYFAGRRLDFDVPIDLPNATEFQQRVLEETRRVPSGEVVSYAEIARRIGQPHASRAVGQALGRNPVPILIPCHRVVATGGGLGGYTGGLTIKKKLLAIERAAA